MRDVRMRGFERRATMEEVDQWLVGQIVALESEMVSIDGAAGRVLATDVVSPTNVPGYRRAMMDGYAVRADDVAGASPYNRIALNVIDQSLPARPAARRITSGTSIRVMTGAPLPDGADAVLPVEETECSPTDDEIVYATGDVAPRKHIGEIGEDISKGDVVLTNKRRLRPQDAGLLASIGVPTVDVVRRPTVKLVVTGNELVRAGEIPGVHQIVDSNSPMLRALVERDGGRMLDSEILPDDPDVIRNELMTACDVVIVSGGSSVGAEDHAPRLVQEVGELRFHGIAMRPSSPAGLGRIGNRFVFLLPGNPVSCLCAYDFFAGPTIRSLGGGSLEWPYDSISAPLTRKLVSIVGRVDYARVRLTDEGVEPIGISGASLLSSTTKSDGFVVIPSDSEGYAIGTPVEVHLYDRATERALDS